MKIQNYLDFVNRQIAYHDKRAELIKLKRPEDSQNQARLANAFRDLREAMEADISDADSMASRSPRGGGNDALEALLNMPTQLTPGHLVGLPEELISQLKISETDRINWTVQELVSRADGQTMSIDVLLIALFRETSRVFDRTDLSNRLYRMCRKGLLYGVPGRQGLYTTIPQVGQQMTIEEREDQIDEE